MLVSWAYADRNTIIHRLDPRARVIFMLAALFSVGFIPDFSGTGLGAGYWDIRFVVGFLTLALLQIIVARLTWRQMRRFWLIIGIVATMLSLVTFLTGRSASGIDLRVAEHLLWTLQIPLLGVFSISVERLTFLVTQVLRIMTFASLSIVIPYTINPAHYGITFKGLGLGDKLAFAMDLAFRFIPTLGRDMQITIDAQRARGFELELGDGVSFFQRVRNFAPLMIPVTIGAVLGGEEITDAMDLRAFGVTKRTWLTQLKYGPADYALIAFSVLLFAGSIVLKRAGIGGFWVPPFMIS